MIVCKKCGARMAAPEPAEATREAPKADEEAEASRHGSAASGSTPRTPVSRS